MATKQSHWSYFKKKSYVIVTAIFFFISITLHWYYGWQTYKNDQQEHHQPLKVSAYFDEMMRATMENWQSEFLQLIWQVAGLAFLFHVGSPTSKEGDDRKEAKLDYIIAQLDPENANKILRQFEEKYPKK